MNTENPPPCAIDPTRACSCESLEFAKRMYAEVVQSLIEKGLTQKAAEAAYLVADSYFRAMHMPKDVANNCLYSPVEKI